ncbi:hypothetical protein CARUB_v10022390mg [Capsella rubella]|uniref:Transmembrane protein n=1 Tax=Capsella rubella TaxID=81985 RepID=R0GG26_9BRAS|nr:hypothetical protein CARUB_v10022390mg [Capsella rubella]
MSSKTSHIIAFSLSLLLMILALSSQVGVVDATSRKLIARGTPIIWTPGSKSCGASHASWTNKPPRPCKRPPRYVPVSTQSP